MKNSKQVIEVPWNWKHSVLLWIIVLLGMIGVSLLVVCTKNENITEFVFSGPFKGNFIIIVDLVFTLIFALHFMKFPEFIRYIGFKRLNKKWIFISFLSGVLFIIIGELVFCAQNLIMPMPEERVALYEQIFFVENWKGAFALVYRIHALGSTV
jgi:hypothetical protein